MRRKSCVFLSSSPRMSFRPGTPRSLRAIPRTSGTGSGCFLGAPLEKRTYTGQVLGCAKTATRRCAGSSPTSSRPSTPTCCLACSARLRSFGINEPVALNDLFASAAHRALSSLHGLTGGDYRRTRDSITDLFVTSMPGLEPNERMNIGLVAPALRAVLHLSPRMRAQYVV